MYLNFSISNWVNITNDFLKIARIVIDFNLSFNELYYIYISQLKKNIRRFAVLLLFFSNY